MMPGPVSAHKLNAAAIFFWFFSQLRGEAHGRPGRLADV